MKPTLLLILALLMGAWAHAQTGARENDPPESTEKITAVPTTIDFQGRLYDIVGNPVNATLTITFSIYTDAEGVTFYNLLWEETRSVVVSEGLFQVKLGEVVPISPDVFQYPDRWLALRVAGEPEMSPRTKISSTGYAMQAIEKDPTWEGGENPIDPISRSGNVGIGIETPLALLHTRGVEIGEGTIIFEGERKVSPGGLPVSGPGTRFMWYPDKGAIRAGHIDGAQWDDAGIGFYSVGTGYSTLALGDGSVAMGANTAATGVSSFAMGFGTTVTTFAGTALGRYNVGGGSTNSWVTSDPLFEIGRGDSEGDRRNALTVLKNGNVGIGPSTPQYRLDIWAPGTTSTGIAVFRNSLGETKVGIRQNSNECGAINIYHSGSTVGASIAGNGNSFFNGGNVGIGTETPDTRLVIKTSGSADVFKILSETGNSVVKFRQASNNSGAFYLYDPSNVNTVFLYGGGNSHITGGYLGLGTTSPIAGLHLKGTGSPASFMAIQSDSGNDAGIRFYEGSYLEWQIGNNSASGGFLIQDLLSHPVFFANQSGNVGIGTTTPATRLDVRGNVYIRDNATGNIAVKLGTGLDYAEGFNASGKQDLEPGTVLCIDPENPGNLRISTQAYDTKVAGIVAGANNLGSGISLGADVHDLNVALAGRVYCHVDASKEAIQAGDLLTTSEMPGFAMKATDREKSQGAILGKAMESLGKGQTGMILVLVSLQ